jgi:hypothetical protein
MLENEGAAVNFSGIIITLASRANPINLFMAIIYGFLE